MLLVAAAILVVGCLVGGLVVARADVNHLHHHRLAGIPTLHIKLTLELTGIAWGSRAGNAQMWNISIILICTGAVM